MKLKPSVSHARRALVGLAAGMCLFGAQAQPVIKMILVYPPGGSNDVVARILQPHLAQELGATIVIENKAGANGSIGTDFVAKAAPDGSTLLLVSASPITVVPHVMKVGYDTVRDLAPISMVGSTPEALGVHPNSPANNLSQFLERAKKEDLRLASSGNGGLPHLAIELLKSVAGGKVVHVPYKGGGPAISDAIAGHVDGVMMDLSALIPHFRGGKLRPLVVTSAQRDPLMPDVPTAKEAGLGDFEAVNWVGIFAPAKTPAPVIDKVQKAVANIVARPEIAQRLREAALAPAPSTSSAEFTRFIAAEHAKWGRVAKAAGLRNE